MAMELPLGSVLPGIFMVELETSVIPTLGWSLMKWKDMYTTHFLREYWQCE